MRCPNCKIEARVAGVNENKDGTATIRYICVNPRCKNNREQVGEKIVKTQA